MIRRFIFFFLLFPTFCLAQTPSPTPDCASQIISSLQELNYDVSTSLQQYKNETASSLKSKLALVDSQLNSNVDTLVSVSPENQWLIIDLSFYPDPEVSSYAKKLMLLIKEVDRSMNHPYTFGNLGFGKLYEIFNATPDSDTKLWAMRQMGRVDTSEAIGFYLCKLLDPQTDKAIAQQALTCLQALGDGDEKWGFDAAFGEANGAVVDLLVRGCLEIRPEIHDPCVRLVKKLYLDEGLPDHFLTFLGGPDKELSDFVRRKLLEGPDKRVAENFDQGSVPFKLEAIDILQSYGTTSMVSYQTLMDAACDADPGVKSKAIKVLVAKGVPPPTCASAVGPTPTPEPSFRFVNPGYNFDGLYLELATQSLRPDTVKLVVDLTYSKATIDPFKPKMEEKRVTRKSDDTVECVVEPNNGQDLQMSFYMGRNDAPPPKPGFWQELFSKKNAHPVFVTAKATAYCADGSHYKIPAQEYDFSFLDKAWKELAKKTYDDMGNNFRGEWGDRRPDITENVAPSVAPLDMGDTRPFLVLSIGAYMGGGGGSEEITVLRDTGHGCETVFSTGGSMDMGYEVIPWRKSNLLKVEDNANGDGKGRFYLFLNGKIKEVFEYDASDCAFQAGCSFQTKVVDLDGKLFLYRQNEQRPDYAGGGDDTSDARPQRAEIKWNGITQSFELGPFEPVNEYSPAVAAPRRVKLKKLKAN